MAPGYAESLLDSPRHFEAGVSDVNRGTGVAGNNSKKKNKKTLTFPINRLQMDMDNVPQEFMTFGHSFVGAG